MRFHKTLAALTLCTFVAGCASYRSASLPGGEPVEVDGKRVEEVWVGQKARITLTSGEVVSDEIRAVSADSITVGHVGNFGLDKVTVGSGEIALLEVEHASTTANLAAYSVMGVLAVGVIALAASGTVIDALSGSN